MSTMIEHKQIRIDGMTCQECCNKVARALGGVDGVQVESVDLGAATITADNQHAVAEARMAIDSLGYSARPELETPPSANGSAAARNTDARQARDKSEPSGIARATSQGVRDANDEDNSDDDAPEVDEDSPAAAIHRAPTDATKKVGDAGRDDRDRGEPMPERVKGPKTPGANAPSHRDTPGSRPANRDQNPTTNPASDSESRPGARR